MATMLDTPLKIFQSVLLLLSIFLPSAHSFSITHNGNKLYVPKIANTKKNTPYKTSTCLFMSFESNKDINPSPSTEFALQELRAQLTSMNKSDVFQLPPAKRIELESYVRTIAKSNDSPVPLGEIGKRLVGTTWKLVFSTEDVVLSSLPKEARVMIEVVDEKRLNYILKFTKRVFALKSLTAKSIYEVDSGPINPGLVTYQYQEITSDIFGMTIPTGLFGMLKGRITTIESMYFDGTFWIERSYTPEGMDYYNVYLRQED